MKVWLAKLNLVHPPAKNARICQFHFEEKFIIMDHKFVIAPHLYKKPKYYLADDAIPTIFAHTDRELPVATDRSTSVQRKTLKRRRRRGVSTEC